MKLNRNFFFLSVFLQLFIFSCSKCQDIKEISGEYFLGHGGYVPNPQKIEKGIKCLLLDSNNTFILYEVVPSEKGAISGIWKIKSCKTVETIMGKSIESTLQFKIKNRKINAKCFNGRAIIFDHPREFYGDENKILKYSKIASENI